MLQYLKTGVSVLAVAALFLAPAATVTIVTADSAYAKNGNGNGNGGGKGGGNRGGGASKGGDKGDKGARGNGNGGGNKGARGNGNKGGNISAKAKGNKGFKGFGKNGNKGNQNKSASKGGFRKGLKDFGNGFKNDVSRLFGKKSNGNGSAKNRTSVTRVSAPSKSLRPPTSRPARYEDYDKFGTLHPSQLGKLNGAINSSPRAKEAHIANGQYMNGSGPVSLAAALAVADYEYAQALDDFNMAVETVALAEAFETLDAATEDELTAAQDIFTSYDADMDGFLSEEERETAIEDTTDTETPLSEEDLDTAQTLGDAARLTEGEEEPEAEDVEEAQDIVDAGEPSTEGVEDAEDNLLAHYKGDLPTSDDPDMRLSEQEQAVVDTVRDNNPDEETVGDALESYQDRMDTDEDDMDDEVTIDGEDGDMMQDDTDSAMIEDETSEG